MTGIRKQKFGLRSQLADSASYLRIPQPLIFTKRKLCIRLPIPQTDPQICLMFVRKFV